MSFTIPIKITFPEDCKMSDEQKKAFAESVSKNAIESLQINNNKLYSCNICKKFCCENKMKYFDKNTKIGICDNKECYDEIDEEKFKHFTDFLNQLENETENIVCHKNKQNDAIWNKKIGRAWKMYNDCMTKYGKEMYDGIINMLEDPYELLSKIDDVKLALNLALETPSGKIYFKYKNKKLPGTAYEIIEYLEYMADNF